MSGTAPRENLDALPTEQPNPRTADLDRLDTLPMLERLNAEDRQVPIAVHAALPEIARAVELAVERWQRGGRIVLFGAGTSGRLAALDAAEMPPTYGTPPERYVARLAGGAAVAQRAVEGAEDDEEAGRAAAADLGPNDVAFGLAASGRTPYVIGALAEARRRGAATLAMACVPSPAIGRDADVCIVVDTGPEPVSGSTRMKAGTAQKLVLNAFSTALMVKLGKVYGNLMVDVQATNAKLRRRAVRLVELATGADGEAASMALDATGGNVKAAILALRQSLPAEQALATLAEHDSHLRRALGEA